MYRSGWSGAINRESDYTPFLCYHICGCSGPSSTVEGYHIRWESVQLLQGEDLLSALYRAKPGFRSSQISALYCDYLNLGKGLSSKTWIIGGATPEEAIVLRGQYCVLGVVGFPGRGCLDNS